MYVSTISISNLRCFADAELALNCPDGSIKEAHLPNVNLLLGTNGAGKTTILKALALGVLSPVIQNSGYVPYYLIRRTKARRGKAEPRATIRTGLIIHGKEGKAGRSEDVSTEIIPQGTLETIHSTPDGAIFAEIELSDETSSAFFMVGYGATRRVESSDNVDISSRKRRTLRYQRVAGLFEEYIGLTSLGAWLPTITSRIRRMEIVDLINALLPTGTHFTGRLDTDREPLFNQRGVDLPFSALSDGYRAYIGLVGDVVYHLQQIRPARTKLIDLPGLVLVDDVDLHLHPSWQREVVPKLARTFPRLQFVLTSHSPLVAGTLHAENIFLVEADDDGPSHVRKLTEPIHGLNADQVLTSSYFDLETTRSPDAQRNLARLARNAENGNPKEAVKFLRALSKKQAVE